MTRPLSSTGNLRPSAKFPGLSVPCPDALP